MRRANARAPSQISVHKRALALEHTALSHELPLHATAIEMGWRRRAGWAEGRWEENSAGFDLRVFEVGRMDVMFAGSSCCFILSVFPYFTRPALAFGLFNTFAFLENYTSPVL